MLHSLITHNEGFIKAHTLNRSELVMIRFVEVLLIILLMMFNIQ